MAVTSHIEWTDATWNPVRGCSKISPGCKHCYAATFAERFRGVKGHPYEHGFDIRLVPEKLVEPLKWADSKMVFVNSMSDLFHPEVPDHYIDAVAQVMVAANWHTFQVLTKRSERLKQLLSTKLKFSACSSNIWWGVSVEDKRYGLPRLEDLRISTASMRFLSIEPLLEDLGEVNLNGIHWVIVGGESGHGARPLEKSWVLSLKKQCKGSGVPFFFKQWGGKKKWEAGRLLDGKTYDEYPERLRVPVPSAQKRRELICRFENKFSAKIHSLFPTEMLAAAQ